MGTTFVETSAHQTAPRSAALDDPAATVPGRPVPLPLAAASDRAATRVGSTDDHAERDADRRGGEALARLTTSGATANRPPDAHRHDPGCGHLRRAADLGPASGATVGSAGGALPPQAGLDIERMRGGGRPLEPSVRRRMEEGFGTSFADVRIHDGPIAERLNRDLAARAFTTGSDVFFGKRHYAPGTPEGDRVLAHELAHTLQPDQGAVQRLGAGSAAPTSPPPIRRMKLLGPEGPIHVNDYHFIDRMAMTNGPASGPHDVILAEFDDLAGLRTEAVKHLRKTSGEKFEFGGFTWNWRGKEELFPVADGKKCVTLSAEQIKEMTTNAATGTTKDAKFALLKNNDFGRKVSEAFRSTAQKSAALQLPIVTTPGRLKGLPLVKFAAATRWSESMSKGGESFEAFLWGPHGRKEEGPHLHLFLSCKPKSADVAEDDHVLTLKSLHLTTSAKDHLQPDADMSALDHRVKAEVEELLTICDMLDWARTDNESDSSSEDEVDEFTANASELMGNCSIIGDRFAVRPAVMRHFLVNIVQADAQDIAAYAHGELNDTIEEYTPDLKLLSGLEATARKHDVTADTVIKALPQVASDYPYDDVDGWFDRLGAQLTKTE